MMSENTGGKQKLKHPAFILYDVKSFLSFGIWQCFFLSFLVTSAVRARTNPVLIANPEARTAVSMNGPWHVIVDPYENGLSSRYYENRKGSSKRELIEYDFDQSSTFQVPGDWNTQRADLFFYEGIVWYEKSFPYRKHAHKRSFLHFGAANYFARVYLNGKELGTHTGGFTPFDFEITDTVNDGENFVVVEVNNMRRADGIPALSTDWWNYGGITGRAEILEVPDTFIENYFLHLAKGSAQEISGWVQLNKPGNRQPVTIEIPEARIKQTIEVGPDGRAVFRFSARLERWSPENPKLYNVIFKTGSDQVSEEIGFRSIEVRGTQILLNGNPVFLRGISFHDEAPGHGRTGSEADSQQLLSAAKELGCNFVRLAHYPHSESTLRLADKIGLLVWSEVPVYWGIDWENPSTLENAKSQMRDMIARDRNRAAIILWSLSNETPTSPVRTEFLKRLAAATREADDTRLLTSAMNHTTKNGPDQQMLDDPLGEYLDVLGLNEYVGWYSGSMEDLWHLRYAIKWKKPLIVSEFGADALAGKHADVDVRFGEEYQAKLYTGQIEMLRKIPELAGISPWVLYDFRSPRKALAGDRRFLQPQGLAIGGWTQKAGVPGLAEVLPGTSPGPGAAKALKPTNKQRIL